MVTLSVVSRRNAFDDVVSLFSPRTVGSVHAWVHV
jgi:hypothetical protein